MGVTGTQGASHPAEGWHDDPTGRHQHRYWDGRTWTPHVADGGQQSVDPLENAMSTGTRAKTSLSLRSRLLELPVLTTHVTPAQIAAILGEPFDTTRDNDGDTMIMWEDGNDHVVCYFGPDGLFKGGGVRNMSSPDFVRIIDFIAAARAG